jgi:CBS domain-containing protein
MAILRGYERLDTTKDIENLLFMQSIEGRAHNGSGAFDKATFVNTTIDDIVRALEARPAEVKAARQKLIDDIVRFAEDAMHHDRRDRLVNASGEPFLGVPLFRDRRVNARDVLRGIYIGGLRDNPDVRRAAEARYQVKIGFGKCFLVDTRVMLKMGLDAEMLAHEAHEDRIPEYVEKGLILERAAEGQEPEDGVRYYYIRYRLGPGQSDDAAIVTAGLLYNTDVALGVFLADAIDTLEKYAPAYKEQDQELAFFIARGFKDLGITEEDVHEIAYLAAIPEAEEELVPDSSLRYLLAVDPRTSRTVLQTHLAFIEGRPVSDIPVSFKRILTTEFYEYVKRRLVNARRLDALSLPELEVEELGRAVGEMARKNHVVVSKDEPLGEVIRKFRESKSEIVIVVDKNQHVVGTLTAADLIHYFRSDGRT